MARPTDYDPKYAEEIIEYFSADPYTEKERDHVTKSGDVVKIYEDVATDFRSFAGFAAKIGVHRDTLHEWCKKHEEFSDAYKRAKELQENFILINGMKELTPPAFTIFVSKNVLGYRDKQPGEADVIVNNLNRTEEDLVKREAELEAKWKAEIAAKMGAEADPEEPDVS